jgi:hypothetical protein
MIPVDCGIIKQLRQHLCDVSQSGVKGWKGARSSRLLQNTEDVMSCLDVLGTKVPRFVNLVRIEMQDCLRRRESESLR